MPSEALQAALAENVRTLAEKRGVSLDVLADLAGVSRRQLYNMLSGEHDVTIGWLEKIADALEVEMPELLRRS